MVDRAKLHERLMATFVDELAEHVDSINACVLELEGADDLSAHDETMAKLFRAAHSLKGASRAVDIPPIEQICHKLEDVFTAIRESRLILDSAVASVILAVADAVGAAGRHMRNRQPVAEDHFQSLPQQLEALASGRPADVVPAGGAKAEIHSATAATSADATSPSDTEASGDGTGAPSSGTSTSDIPASPAAARTAESAEPVRTESGDHLPRADGAAQESPRTTKAPDQTAESVPSSRPLSGMTVRVAEEKLDNLMAQAGELLIARQRLEMRPEEVESLTTAVAECRSDYQIIERSLTEMLESVYSPEEQTMKGVRGSGALMTGTLSQGQGTMTLTSTRARMLQIIGQTGTRLRHIEQQLEDFQRRLLTDVRQLNHTGDKLQQDIHHIRMLPFTNGCVGLDRALRDLATATGKQVSLTIEGGDIEVDRTVLEGLRDPLLHLVRNAVDHGLESPEERTVSGKPAEGQLKIEASLKGPQVEITISDDGKGLDRNAILKKRRDKGLPDPFDDRELCGSIFLPGFSTAGMITDVSGRGVGLDVVKSQLEKLHGTIELSSQPGLGTRFRLCVPLTLTTLSALFVRSGGNVYGLPNTNVARLVRFRPGELRAMGGQNVLPNEDTPIPVVTLSAALQMSAGLNVAASAHLLAVVLTTGDRELAVIVDELLGERDAVVKSLGPQIRHVRHVSGATLLRNGQIAMLLNVTTLVRGAAALTGFRLADSQVAESGKKARVHVLVVDDSITTRSLLRNILEAAGYEVSPAVDGTDAWNRLQSGGFDLVLTDVDMPNMDGFELTEKIRQSESTARLPVILVTSRDSESDKTRGVQVGADAYLVKSTFEQSHVLDIIEQLL